ncbi:hypothetical protein L6452_10448 [Arctium lappa]|uniref:Uncharacterized protein n=1 Tax=Arctium lappa TaxID=4217 RepID=A0ACB9DMU0_ARCLA|nr:hypothetical protein L6452_10448 [Arctium lappa]
MVTTAVWQAEGGGVASCAEGGGSGNDDWSTAKSGGGCDCWHGLSGQVWGSRRTTFWRRSAGFQVAYGILAEVEEHPFDVVKMLFMDWRNLHLDNNLEIKGRNSKIPHFPLRDALFVQ